jgi:predicted metal-dependent hydrolase
VTEALPARSLTLRRARTTVLSRPISVDHPAAAIHSALEITMTDSYDPRYLKGIEYFNGCDFFEAHEVWEELWQEHEGPSRRFYQGLIQAAVCLHHFGNGNTRGAAKLFHSCRGYLEPYGAWHEGINVQNFLKQLEECCQDLLTGDTAYSSVQIDPERIPEIHLSAE